MKIIIITLMALQLVLFGIGYFQIISGDILAGIFNLIINTIGFIINLQNLKNNY
jgi:hypothetical protein